MAKNDPDLIQVSIDRSGDEYFVTLTEWDEDAEPGEDPERVDFAEAFRCRRAGDRPSRSEASFALSWCDHEVVLETFDDVEIVIDGSGGIVRIEEPFQVELRRVPDSIPAWRTWVTDVHSMMPIVIELRDATRVDLADEKGLAKALSLDGPTYRFPSGERALYVAPRAGTESTSCVDFGSRQSIIFDGSFDGSFDGEWRATGSILARGEPWGDGIDASIQAVLDDLHTAQIRCESWPRARGRDAGERWDALCRGVGDRAGSVALTGSTSSVGRNGMPAEIQPGWSGVLEWKDGRRRLVAGPGENRFRIQRTRAPAIER